MIVKSFKLNDLKKTNLNFFLFYGENEGHKSQIINSLIDNDIEQTIFEEKEILDNIHETHAYISIGLTHIVPIILGTYCLFAVPQPRRCQPQH